MVTMGDEDVVDEEKQALVRWVNEDKSARGAKNMARKKTGRTVYPKLATEKYRCQTLIRKHPLSPSQVDVFILFKRAERRKQSSTKLGCEVNMTN